MKSLCLLVLSAASLLATPAFAEDSLSLVGVDARTLDYCYTEAGASPRAVCARLTRQP